MIGSHPQLLGRLRRSGAFAVVVLALAGVGAWTGLFDVFGDSTIDREKVEQAATTGLIHQGVNASHVSCPDDLEKKLGARVVCTYTDFLSDVVGKAMLNEDAPPPRKGRVEIRVSGFDTRNFGPRAGSSFSTPELSARIIDRAR
jgi:hypothetical protein